MNTSHPTSSSRTAPVPATQAQIAALAHEIWRERGCPEGSDMDIWLEAERELNGEVARRSHVDPIPADPSNTDVDHDPALRPMIDREFRGVGDADKGERSPTSM